MKNNLYVTQVNFRKTARSKSIVDGVKKDKKNNSSAYLVKNKGFLKVKKSILEYMMSDQTQYADLDKCEEFYEKLFYTNYKDHNTYKSELSQKKKRLKEMDAMIEKVI